MQSASHEHECPARSLAVAPTIGARRPAAGHKYAAKRVGTGCQQCLVVGSSGTIARWDGVCGGRRLARHPHTLNSIWGADANNIWAVGEQGTIAKWDGTAWFVQCSIGSMWFPDSWDPYLTGVWGSDAAHVWVVGSSGTILFWDGNLWTAVSSGTTNHLLGIWGSGCAACLGGRRAGHGSVLEWQRLEPANE